MSEESKVQPVEVGSDKEHSEKNDFASLKAEIEALKREKASWSERNTSLNDRVKQDHSERAKKDSDTKTLESALTFNLTSSEFLKANEAVLPKEIPDIFRMAEKEKYENAVQKANATKAAVIQSFFTLQANLDLLTETQKSNLADYLKLTKNGKEDKADEMYQNLFEPALGTLKRVKKAEEISRSRLGFKDGNGDSHYKQKLMGAAQKTYLGEKK